MSSLNLTCLLALVFSAALEEDKMVLKQTHCHGTICSAASMSSDEAGLLTALKPSYSQDEAGQPDSGSFSAMCREIDNLISTRVNMGMVQMLLSR